MNKKKEWVTNEAQDFTLENIQRLFLGQIPAVIIKNFISKDQCSKILENLKTRSEDSYAHVDVKVYRYGLSFSEKYANGQLQNYFDQVAFYYEDFEKIFSPLGRNPIFTIVDKFGPNASVMQDNNRKYFAGTFRYINGHAPIHFDYAPLECPDQKLAQVQYQLTFNLYLKTSKSGGALHVYDDQGGFENKDEFKEKNYFHYRDEFTERKKFVYEPVQGDLLFFNSQNFHEILAPSEMRITQSAFIGLLPNEKIIFWS